MGSEVDTPGPARDRAMEVGDLVRRLHDQGEHLDHPMEPHRQDAKGAAGNEMADLLAQEAARTRSFDSERELWDTSAPHTSNTVPRGDTGGLG